MTDGRPERIEVEYTRHGTLTLIGNFDVTTGELITPDVGPTRTEVGLRPSTSSRRWRPTRRRGGSLWWIT